jgi:hypothetical protein
MIAIGTVTASNLEYANAVRRAYALPAAEVVSTQSIMLVATMLTGFFR